MTISSRFRRRQGEPAGSGPDPELVPAAEPAGGEPSGGTDLESLPSVVLGSATGLLHTDQLGAESWASLWLGEAWRNAEGGDPEQAVQDFVAGLAQYAPQQPDLVTLAALRAIRAVAPVAARPVLDQAVDLLLDALPEGAEVGAWEPFAWTVRDAARYLDPWGCERFLVVVLDGPQPHALLLAIDPSVGGVQFLKVMDVQHADTFFVDWPAHLPPMTRDGASPAVVMSEAAGALRLLDAGAVKDVDDDTATYRALAWTRCRPFLRRFPPREHMSPALGLDLAREFLGREPAGDPESFCVELLLDFGDGYMHDLLAWSPHWVARFLLDFVPRNAVLLEGDRDMLPQVLRRWVRFALTKRGLPEQWVTPVLDAVDEHQGDFARLVDED